MKLYVVIYIAGLIGGTVGPLPYDSQECRARIASFAAELDHDVVTPNGFTAADIRLACEWHRRRPPNHPDSGKAGPHR